MRSTFRNANMTIETCFPRSFSVVPTLPSVLCSHISIRASCVRYSVWLLAAQTLSKEINWQVIPSSMRKTHRLRPIGSTHFECPFAHFFPIAIWEWQSTGSDLRRNVQKWYSRLCDSNASGSRVFRCDAERATRPKGKCTENIIQVSLRLGRLWARTLLREQWADARLMTRSCCTLSAENEVFFSCALRENAIQSSFHHYYQNELLINATDGILQARSVDVVASCAYGFGIDEANRQKTTIEWRTKYVRVAENGKTTLKRIVDVPRETERKRRASNVNSNQY